MKKTQDYLREFLNIFFVRHRLILSISALCTVASCLMFLLWPSRYEATGSLLLKENKVQKSPDSIEEVRRDIPQVESSDLYSEIQLFQSTDVIEKTIYALGSGTKIFSTMAPESDLFRQTRAKISHNLSTELFPNSNVFLARLTWDDPDEAQQILKVQMDEYLRHREQIYKPKEAAEFFRRQLERFEVKLHATEDQLIEHVGKTAHLDTAEKIKNNLEISMDLERNLNQVQTQLIESKNHVVYLRKELASDKIKFFSQTDNLGILALSENLNRLVEQRAQLVTVFHPESDKVRRVDENIKMMYAYLKDEVRAILENEENKVKIFEGQIADLRNRLTTINKQNLTLYQDGILTERIQRNKKLYEDSYNTFAKRYEEANISNSSNEDHLFSVSIVSQASSNHARVFPTVKVIPVGIFMGMILGFMVGFLLEFFDHSFKRPEDVTNFTGFDYICHLPEMRI